MGFAETSDGRQTWMIGFAAENSDGLCGAIAAACSEALKGAPRNFAPLRIVLGLEGAAFIIEGPTKRVRREL